MMLVYKTTCVPLTKLWRRQTNKQHQIQTKCCPNQGRRNCFQLPILSCHLYLPIAQRLLPIVVAFLSSAYWVWPVLPLDQKSIVTKTPAHGVFCGSSRLSSGGPWQYSATTRQLDSSTLEASLRSNRKIYVVALRASGVILFLVV